MLEKNNEELQELLKRYSEKVSYYRHLYDTTDDIGYLFLTLFYEDKVFEIRYFLSYFDKIRGCSCDRYSKNFDSN